MVWCALLAFGVTPAPAAPVRDPSVPLRLTVAVVAPDGAAGPTPTGRVSVFVDDRRVLSVPLVGGILQLSRVTPAVSVALETLGQRVTVSYSGDGNYEASDELAVTIPTRAVATIVARPRDTAAPVVVITAPGDGARYARGDVVVARYACQDPDDRSTVTACDGPVASGSAIDTARSGVFAFEVRTADALGNAATRTVRYTVVDLPAGSAGSPPDEPAGQAGPAPAGLSSRGSAGAGNAGGSLGSAAAPPPAPPAAVAPAIPTVPRAIGSLATRSSASGSSSRRPPRSPARGRRGTAASTTGSSTRATPARQELAAYDPRSQPARTLELIVAAFALLQLGATGGLAYARGGRDPGRASDEPRAPERGSSSYRNPVKYRGIDVRFLSAGWGGIAIGDRSRTWGWPGTHALDAVGPAVPGRLARRSQLVARVVADGTYLRAILGSASLLGPLAGLVLGIAAVQEVGGDAMPPATRLTIAIAVLGVLDATAGFVAVLTFAIGVLIDGGVGSSADVRLMLGLAALWFVVPVVAGAARPLRRPPTTTLEESWERAADFVIASLIGAWAVQRIVLALPALAGVHLTIAEHADAIAGWVLAALVVRLAGETLAAHLYPRRLDISEAGNLPEPALLQRFAATAWRTTIFLFVSSVAVGTGWQLWTAAALFVTPQVLAIYQDRLPNSRVMIRALPTGLARIVLTLGLGTAVAALALTTMDRSSRTFVADSFVLLSLPGFALNLMGVFGRRAASAPIGWGKRVAGVALLAVGILLASEPLL